MRLPTRLTARRLGWSCATVVLAVAGYDGPVAAGDSGAVRAAPLGEGGAVAGATLPEGGASSPGATPIESSALGVTAAEGRPFGPPATEGGPVNAASTAGDPVDAASADSGGRVNAASTAGDPVDAASTDRGPVDAASTDSGGPVDAASTASGPVDAASMTVSYATMQCARVSAAPARVRCAVEARVGDGEAIAWGDAVLVTLPSFVAALRGRTGPRDAAERDAAMWRWELGLVARGRGEGAVGGRARLVVCKKGVCEPRVLPFQGHVAVGD